MDHQDGCLLHHYLPLCVQSGPIPDPWGPLTRLVFYLIQEEYSDQQSILVINDTRAYHTRGGWGLLVVGTASSACDTADS